MPKNVDEAIGMLDSMLESRNQTANEKKASIDSIRLTFKDKKHIPAEALERLGDLYRRINLDSAISCYRRALAITPGTKANHIKMKISALLPVKGMTREAMEMRESISRDRRHPLLRQRIRLISIYRSLLPRGGRARQLSRQIIQLQ